MNIFKSERFWLALIAMGFIGALSIAGRISGGEGVSALMALLAGFGVGRGITKSEKCERVSKSIFPLILVAGLAQGCSANPMGAIDKSVKAVQLASQIVMPIIHEKCMAEARKCQLARDKICSDWMKCDADRERFRLAVDSVQDALSTAASIIERICANDACAEMRDK